MPVKPNYIEVPAVIRKDDIEAYGRLHGYTNSSVLAVNRDGFEFKFLPRTARLLTFAGALDEQDGLYHGHYRFEQGNFENAEAADLGALPGLPIVTTNHGADSGELSDGI